MARSIAILLMIEGHFTGAALSADYRTYDYWLFALWHNLHGLTSPLFFAVTGVVFVYLLGKSNDVPYFSNERVRKGFKRVRMLLFWGYFIQFNFIVFGKSLYYGFKNVFNGNGWVFHFHFDWFYAFHVLQSIAIGIFLLLIIYGVYRLINKGALYWYYLIAGIILFTIYGYMKHHIWWDDHLIELGKMTNKDRHFWPENAPKFIQNMFYGQFSDFSFVRYSGYTIMGGMIGSLIRTYEYNVKKWWFGASFIIIGLIFAIASPTMFRNVDAFTNWIGLTDFGHFVFNGTSFSRLGQVAILLGILMLIDSYYNVKAHLFLKIGQNTFPIYIVHVIILYGGILGLGLDSSEWFHRQFNPWIAVSISTFFIGAFFYMVKYIEPLSDLYYRIFGFLYFSRKKKQLKSTK
jgi:hypothetical protein